MSRENGFSKRNPAVWRNSDSICALVDDDRHLGHVLRDGGLWRAFDATHFNEEANGFRPLGSFASMRAAKEAVASPVFDAMHRAGAAFAGAAQYSASR
ncbi:MAG: hypothetical protein ABUS51_04295 [Acidobacteriota bacterium]